MGEGQQRERVRIKEKGKGEGKEGGAGKGGGERTEQVKAEQERSSGESGGKTGFLPTTTENGAYLQQTGCLLIIG